MAKMVFEVLGVEPDRVDELCDMFIGEGGQFSDEVILSLLEADLTTNEKLVVTFALGFLSAIDLAANPTTIIKKNDYVH
jgi:hypothetical protein